MVELNYFRHLFTVQLIIVIVGNITAEGFGMGFVKSAGKLTGSVARGLSRIPSKVMDGSQYVTQKVAGTTGNVARPVGPLKSAIDATGSAVSNVLGTSSRLLGKSYEHEPDVIFLYNRSLSKYGTSPTYQETLKTVIGLALENAVFHADEMDGDSGDENDTPELDKLGDNLQAIGVPENDINDVLNILGRNGHKDLPKDMLQKVVGIIKNVDGTYRSEGPIQELLWIYKNRKGFHELDKNEKTEYKLNTQGEYNNCVVILPITKNTDIN